MVVWCVGQVVERNTDGRSFKTIDGERVKVNFLIFYEIDQQTVSVKTVLRIEIRYDSDGSGPFTQGQFLQHYKGSLSEWNKATRLPSNLRKYPNTAPPSARPREGRCPFEARFV